MSTSVAESQETAASTGRRSSRAWARKLGPGNISVVYIYALMFVVFTLWIPSLWLNWTTFTSTLNISFAVPTIVALALVLPLLAGLYDLSVGATMSATGITVAWLLVNEHWATVPAILVTMLLALVIGLLNALIVVRLRISSFIGTLAMSAILLAYSSWRSNSEQLTGFPQSFSNFGTNNVVGGIQEGVFFALAIAVVLWFIAEHTPVGRFFQATGANEEAAKLAGIRTARYQFLGLVASALIAGFGGIVLTASINAGESDIGSPYLLSAFAAAFLGATQFKGRFNVWGTVAAVWVLASGVQGVTLAVGSEAWLNNLFFGVALIAAVGSSVILERWRTSRTTRRRVQVVKQRRMEQLDGAGSPHASATGTGVSAAIDTVDPTIVGEKLGIPPNQGGVEQPGEVSNL
jgi:ribose transport system permease protein